MGYIASGMECFPATSMTQLAYIKRVIDDCDYYILVIGGRYGSVTNDGISFTEAEYDYAVARSKPILAFIHESPGDFSLNVVDGNPELRTKLVSFREKASRSRIVKYWKSGEQLAHQATTSLHQAIRDYPAIGWVRGDFEDHEVRQDFRRIQADLRMAQYELSRLEEKLEETLVGIKRMFMDKTKPATAREIEAWVQGAQANYPDAASKVRTGKDTRFAEEDFILAPLYGASSVTVIVAKGVHVYRVGEDIGHSTLLFMDGFRVEGL